MYLQSVIKQQSVAMVKEGTSVIGDILGSQVNLLDFSCMIFTDHSSLKIHRSLNTEISESN